MRNRQPNPQALRADRRFDAIVKKQEGEHRHIISSHHKEMQALRDSLRLAMERFEAISKRNEQDLQEFKTFSLDHICLIKDRMIANDTIISEQKKTIESLHKQLNEFHESHASTSALEKLKQSVQLEIKANTVSHLNSFQEFQREFKTLIISLQNDLFKLRYEIEKKIDQLTEKDETNFNVSRLDRDGVLNQVRIYEKSMFIIEKKIENIYTLIERINNRGELCHKPA